MHGDNIGHEYDKPVSWIKLYINVKLISRKVLLPVCGEVF
jgi:hypothetical protein